MSIFLRNEGLITLNEIFNPFVFQVFIAGSALIVFLSVFNQYINFESLTEIQRLSHLALAVLCSLLIYFGVSLMLGIRLKHFR